MKIHSWIASVIKLMNAWTGAQYRYFSQLEQNLEGNLNLNLT